MFKKIMIWLMSYVMIFASVSVLSVQAEGKDQEAPPDISEDNTDPAAAETPASDMKHTVIDADIHEAEEKKDQYETAAYSNRGYAYAVLNGEGELIFFRSEQTYTDKSTGNFNDIYGNEYSGIIYSGIESFGQDGTPVYENIPWHDNAGSVKSVRVADGQSIQPTSMAFWFYSCSNLVNIDLAGFDTADTVSMQSMFDGCSKITSLDLSALNVSNVRNMRFMFNECKNVTDINMTGWDTSNVTNMCGMFLCCESLKNLDVSHFDTSSVITMADMFAQCDHLLHLDVSNFDTSKVTDMQYMFSCPRLISLNISSFNISAVTDLTGFFYMCDNLMSVRTGSEFSNPAQRVYFPEGTWHNKNIGISLTAAELGEQYSQHAGKWAGEWVRESNAYAVLTKDGELIFFRSSNHYENESSGIFMDMNGTEYTGSVYSSFEKLPAGADSYVPWKNKAESIIKVRAAEGQTIKPQSMEGWFNACTKLADVDFDGFDTSETVSLNDLFLTCRSLTDLDLSELDTSNVVEMNGVFYECTSLKNLKLGNIDTSKVNDMRVMFLSCHSLTELDLSGFDTSNVTSMTGMFSYCYSLERINLSGFDTSQVTDMNGMFRYCESLESLDLSNFNTANVNSMKGMFECCRNLKTLDLGSFDTGNVNDMTDMFNVCGNLQQIRLGQGFTRWTDQAYLSKGNWTNQDIGVSLSETELYEQYPSHAGEWKGIWVYSVPVASITLDTDSLTMQKGESRTLHAEIQPENAANKNIIWNSSDDRIVSVSQNGTVTAVNFGEAFVTAVSEDGKFEATCIILVAENSHDFGTPLYVWSDNNKKVTAKAECSRCGHIETKTVNTVYKITAEPTCERQGSGVYTALFSSEYFIQQTKTIILPETGHDYSLKEWIWAEDNSSCHAVFVCSKGDNYREAEAVLSRNGNKITASVVFEGKTYSYTKEVSDEPISAEEILISESELILALNGTYELSAVIKPANASDKNVTWKSSDPDTVLVNNAGKITGISAGTAVITAGTENGLKAECTVTVMFNDVPAEGKYYSAPVYWAVEKGITNGYRDKDGIVRTFKPQNNCTREAVVTFLWRLAGRPEPQSLVSKFKDVKNPSMYYYKAVLWASEQGITSGYSDGTFRPNAACLREHVVTFLYRYAGKPASSVKKNPFNDIKPSDYYYKAALWANEKGIAKGYSSGAYKGGFGPELECLREHVVTFLYRYTRQLP